MIREKVMNTQLLGSILLIVGTTIGGGMLALPISTSQAGFFYSSLLLFGCWAVMTVSALLLLEINLWLPPRSNIISMAKATLGKTGQMVAWVTYLLLLYSLLAAYIAGGGDFLKNIIQSLHVSIPSGATSILFTLILGYIVFLGMYTIDKVNRFLMFLKLGTFFILVCLVMPNVTTAHLKGGEFQYVSASITVALTSFGFATIIPSLRSHFHDDVRQLRLAIIFGSLIPLICYILWDITVMGVIPREGAGGLVEIMHSGRSTSEFVAQLSAILNKETITVFAKIFTPVCLATSFLGVALSLSHFLADGFGLTKVKSLKNDLIIFIATFLPPILIVLFYPGIFISALSYAGIYCVILLLLLPTLMAWSGRYRRQIAKGYKVKGGKPLLIFMLIISALILGCSFYQIFF